jgi:hypothetical protein
MGFSHTWQATAVLPLGLGIGLSTALGTRLSYGFTGLSYGLAVGLSISVTVVLVSLILHGSLRTQRFAERIHWTWRSLFHFDHLRMTGITIAIAFLLFGLIFGLSYGLNDGLSAGLIFGLSYGLIYWLLLGLYQGMQQEHIEEQSRFQFNQGIRRSLRNGFLISMLSAVIIASLGVLSVGLNDGLSKLCCLAQFGNNLPNTTLSQRPALPKKKVPIRPSTPSRNGFSLDSCLLVPAFG